MRERNAVDNYIRFNPQTGLFEPVYWRRDVMPYCLGVDEQFSNDGTFVINAAGTATAPAIYRIRHASLNMDDFLGNPVRAKYIVFEDSTDLTPNANFTVMVKDMGDKTQFMNQPVHIQTLAGTGQLAASMSEDLFLPTRHALQITFDKVAGGATTIRFFFWGQIYYTWSPQLLLHPMDRAIMQEVVKKYLERRKYIYPFWLTTEQRVVLAANGTFEVDALVGDDGHFEGTHYTQFATGDFGVEISNPETRQNFMNGPISAAAAIGNAQNPQRLPVGMVVPAGHRIHLKFTDLSGAPNTVFFTIRGSKVRAPLKSFSAVKNDTNVNERTIEAQFNQQLAPAGYA